jgi:hypothetical protein
MCSEKLDYLQVPDGWNRAENGKKSRKYTLAPPIVAGRRNSELYPHPQGRGCFVVQTIENAWVEMD